MPASAVEEAAARRLAGLYSEAEAEMRERVRRRLELGITQAGWNERKLLEVATMRTELRQVVAGLDAAVPDAVSSGIRASYAAAAGTVDANLGSHLVGPRTPPRAVLALERSLASGLAGTHFQLLRSTEDVYRRVVAEATSSGVIGVANRRSIAQRMLADFDRRGITGFTDRRGRHWNLDTYAEMASRTALAQAHLSGTVDRLAARGIRFAKVSTSPRGCDACQRWEGKLVQLSGPREAGTPTLDDARSDGLFHPRCTHGLGGYVKTDALPPPATRTADDEAIGSAADDLLARSVAAEPGVTALLRELAPGARGSLQGLRHRLKTPGSLRRKLATDLAATPGSTAAAQADRIFDALRYTYSIPARNYARGTATAMRDLQARGMVRVRTRNTWGDEGYQGVNTVWKTPDGTYFELQFHTPLSLAAKEPGHKMYEAWRVLRPDDPEAIRLDALMRAHWAPVRKRMPVGTRAVGTADELDLIAGELAADAGAPAAATLRAFTGYDETVEAFRDMNAARSLVGDQLADVRDYTGSGYRVTNGLLRGTPESKFVDAAWDTDRVTAHARRVASMDAAMEPLPFALQVHRGVDPDAFGSVLPNVANPIIARRMDGAEDLLVGQRFTDDAFLSTSPIVDERSSFAAMHVQMHLDVPAGHRAAWVDPVSTNATEAELVLDRGTSFIVDRVEKIASAFGGSPTWHVYAHVV